MTRENVKKNMDIISAFAEGKVIQILNERDNWVDLTEREGLPMGTLEDVPDMFRIKPEPKYRPFKDAKECWQEMQKHQPFGWVKYADKYISISAIDSNNDYEIDFDDYTFADSTPFGVKIEE